MLKEIKTINKDIEITQRADRTVGIHGERFPEKGEDLEKLNKGEELKVEHEGPGGKKHLVKYKYKGVGIFKFSVDKGPDHTCYDHPLSGSQCEVINGFHNSNSDEVFPSAVNIYILKGAKDKRKTWATHYRDRKNKKI